VAKRTRVWWRLALVAGCVASLPVGWCAWDLLPRAVRCRDTIFVRAPEPIGDRALSLPVIATPLHASIEGKPGQEDQLPNPDVGGARLYDLGSFRLRVEKKSLSSSYLAEDEGPTIESVRIQDAMSCEDQGLVLKVGYPNPIRDEVATTVALRRDEKGGRYVATFSPPEGWGDDNKYELVQPKGATTPAIAAVAFRPAHGPFPYPLWRTLLVAGAALVLVALVQLRRAALYFRASGISSWKGGRLANGDWIEPDDGGERLRAEGLSAPLGAAVVFTVGMPRESTYRTADGKRAARALVGSHPELAARHAGNARWGCALFAVALVVLLFAMFFAMPPLFG